MKKTRKFTKTVNTKKTKTLSKVTSRRQRHDVAQLVLLYDTVQFSVLYFKVCNTAGLFTNFVQKRTSSSRFVSILNSSITHNNASELKYSCTENKQNTWKYCSAEDGSVRSVKTDTSFAAQPFFSVDSNVLQSVICNNQFYSSDGRPSKLLTEIITKCNRIHKTMTLPTNTAHTE